LAGLRYLAERLAARVGRHDDRNPFGVGDLRLVGALRLGLAGVTLEAL